MKITPPVTLIRQYKKLPVPQKRIMNTALEIYQNERIAFQRSANVIFCSDYIIRKLNSAYRGITRATDVLSFPFGDSDFLGEIYISLPRARNQARRYGSSYEDEIIRLFVHGMFHLLGYDHDTGLKRKKMESKESKYIETRYVSD
ncbi:MAG TPA: rRNA maturation RNase YbeY [Chitinispirillaceae bacterium]|nr:rRNA maturation RNase YbeY [Chitinispirillaceae bacterium]